MLGARVTVLGAALLLLLLPFLSTTAFTSSIQVKRQNKRRENKRAKGHSGTRSRVSSGVGALADTWVSPRENKEGGRERGEKSGEVS